MRRQRTRIVLLLLFVFALSVSVVSADVKQKSKTKMDFKGSLGTVLKFMGAEKPQYTVTYVKGNVMRTDRLDKKGKKIKETDIIDLDRELFIHIRHKKKKYTQMTFDEWRELMQAGLQGVLNAEEVKDEPASEQEKPEAEVKWNFSVDVETPGDREAIAGYQAEKVIVKLKVEAEVTEEAQGDQPEQTATGGINVISTNMVAQDLSGADEIKEFHQRLAEKLGFKLGNKGLAGILSKVMQSNEQLATAMKKIQEEGEKLAGVPVRVHTVFESWGEPPKDMKEEEQQEEIPKSFGGMFKKFGKKKKKKDGPQVLLETITELREFSTAPLSDDLFVVPAKYKLEKKKK